MPALTRAEISERVTLWCETHAHPEPHSDALPDVTCGRGPNLIAISNIVALLVAAAQATRLVSRALRERIAN